MTPRQRRINGIRELPVMEEWKPTTITEKMFASQRDTIIHLHEFLHDALLKLRGPLRTRAERLLYQPNPSVQEPRIKPLNPNPEGS